MTLTEQYLNMAQEILSFCLISIKNSESFDKGSLYELYTWLYDIAYHLGYY